MNATAPLIAPVADYRGIAIVEMDGDRRAVWEGTEYATDGLFHVAWLDQTGSNWRFVGFPSERIARDFIDEYIEGRCDPKTAEYVRNCRPIGQAEMLVLLGVSPEDIVPVAYVWDDAEGHFRAVRP